MLESASALIAPVPVAPVAGAEEGGEVFPKDGGDLRAGVFVEDPGS
jgi:hypothetical protein